MPEFIMKTKIYHPNIDSEGKVCFHFHKGDNWSPALTLKHGEEILIWIHIDLFEAFQSLVAILSYPNPENLLDPDIARIYKTDKEQFEKTAREWTEKYAT